MRSMPGFVFVLKRFVTSEFERIQLRFDGNSAFCLHLGGHLLFSKIGQTGKVRACHFCLKTV